MPLLSYPTSDFVAFTKIPSSDMNGKLNAVKTLLNTTGLDDTNIQSAGITRATKLKVGTIKAIIINDSSTGAMSELAPVASSSVYFNSSSVPTAGVLPLLAGGTGAALTIGNPNDVLQVNAGGSALVFDTSPVPPPVKIFNFYRFS